jgi:hypothetical protein
MTAIGELILRLSQMDPVAHGASRDLYQTKRENQTLPHGKLWIREYAGALTQIKGALKGL